MDVFLFFIPVHAVIQNTSHSRLSFSERLSLYSCRAAVQELLEGVGDRLGNIRYLYLHAGAQL